MSEHGEVSDSTTEADEVDARTTGAADRAATPEEAQMADQHGDALTDSVRELGVLQPVLVRAKDDGYELIAGERRWRAAKRAGLPTIPAVVRTTDDVSSLEQSLVENLHRQDLNALE